MRGTDNRRRERPRIAVTAQIVHGPMKETHAVVVRNMHEGGAKVRLTSTRGVMLSGPVILKLTTEERHCTVVWQAGDEVGLRFSQQS
ncbi:PilZ domain-containing protein [Brevundimonas sp.]|uniref:PilZ domain-containing protein n=1 Tax=Brevundimonas sp. TaxID=1871086 RepID=UPI002D5BBCE9|nr:PilZ domain-containing protein [Brevundimonas sp.]HYC98516.1 PilZ domain-containing protein [Brevundimonas sp.]